MPPPPVDCCIALASCSSRHSSSFPTPVAGRPDASMQSAMRDGASSSAQGLVAPKFGKCTGLPLVACPTCGEDIMELTCGQGSKVPGAIFFKCRLHERDVSPEIVPFLYLYLSAHFDLVERSCINCRCLELAHGIYLPTSTRRC